MSKKINLAISNKKRPNLSLLFHEYIKRKASEPRGRVITYDDYDEDDYEDMAAYWDKMFPGWDDDFDDSDTVFPMLGDTFGLNKNRKAKHKHKKGKNKRGSEDDSDKYADYWNSRVGHVGKNKKKFDIDVPYSGYEECPTEVDDVYYDEYDDGDYQDKVIWFYPDYHDKDDRLEFNSLKAFDKYCTKMGYSVPSYVSADIVYRCESHCCLDPRAEREGVLEIMAEDSYGNMFYEACDVEELSQA